MKKIIVFCCLALLTMLLMPAVLAAEPYDPVVEGIVSGYYGIDQQSGYITGITPGTTVEKLQKVCTPSGIEASDEILKTGTVLTAVVGEQTVTATAIVTGDMNCDGNVSISDMLVLKAHILGNSPEPMRLAAGDLSGDGYVTITDFLKIKSYILGQSDIVPKASANCVPMELLMPGESFSWGAGDRYVSQDAGIVTVEEAGNVLAVAEGTTFVYAYDSMDTMINRILITVLDDPLTLDFAQKNLHLYKEQTQTLVPVLNHPVSAAVTWETSDAQVVTVENGVVQAVGYGSAVITATLENGNQAQVSVTVAPALDSLSVERKLYKVKPNAQRDLTLVMDPADSGEEILWSSSDDSIATVENGVVSGHKYGTVTVTAQGKYSGLTATCQVKVCNVKQVAFTFDDGPSSNTKTLLDFLEKNDIRVTFFLVGNRINSYSSTVLRQMQEGHEIGYHSYDHQNQTKLSDASIKSYYEKSEQILRNITGEGFSLWRTPGGNFNQRVLDCVPLPHIMWSVDSRDWVTRNATSVYNAIRKSPDGAIVLMHDLYTFTVNGAIRAMEEMLAGDYEFLTVTELLSRDGTPPEASVSYNKG